MSMIHIFVLLQAVIWILLVLAYRPKLCKQTLMWTLIVGAVGVMAVFIDVRQNCLAAFTLGVTATEYDLKIMVDTILLRGFVIPEAIRSVKLAFAGDSLIVAALSMPIICRYFRESKLPVFGHKILLVMLYLFVASLIGMLLWIAWQAI